MIIISLQVMNCNNVVSFSRGCSEAAARTFLLCSHVLDLDASQHWKAMRT